MKKFALLAGIAALAACSQEAPTNEEVAEPVAATAPMDSIVGTYEETTPEGKTVTTRINEDGTYTESVDGEVTESGSWTQADGKDCFDPEGDHTPQRCFTTTAIAEDGTFTATNDAGESITVKKISAAAE